MKRKVLIVEDEPDHMEILTRFFLRWGWDVVGMECARSPVPDLTGLALVILDRALPDVCGADLLRQLRADGVTAPAVVVTGMPDDIPEGEFDGLGVDLIVGKDEAYRALFQKTMGMSGGP